MSSSQQKSGTPKRPLNPLTLILGLSLAFFVLFVAISGVTYLTKTPRKSSGSGKVSSSIFGSGNIGVMEVNGVIMDSKRYLRQLKSFEEDSTIRAVLLRLNSPGGAVAPSQEVYERVKHFSKPIYASMGSVAASGAYYIAMGAKKVYANPGTITGSIGVIMEFANLAKLYEWAKVSRYSIKTGKFKDAGADYRALEPDEKALLQGMVDNVLVQFKDAVSEGRNLPPETVSKLADGRIFSGAQAKELNLVDELGTIQDTAKALAEFSGIKGDYELVYPGRAKPRLLDLLMEGAGSGDEDSEAQVPAMGGLLGLAQRAFGVPGVSGARTSLQEQVTGLAPGIYWLWPGAR